MDASPVRSGAKCSSDFSIERILSDDSRGSREESDEVPSWLCCTRYRPPRVPRSVSSGACRGRRAGRHARVPFTAAQAAALEAAYSRAPYLAPPALRALAAALQLRDDRIKIWFQNRRARERREKSTTITPPQDVILPPSQRVTFTSAGPWLHRQIPTSHTLVGQRINDDRMISPVSIHAEMPQDLPISTRLEDIQVYYKHSFSESNDRRETEDDSRSITPLDVESIED